MTTWTFTTPKPLRPEVAAIAGIFANPDAPAEQRVNAAIKLLKQLRLTRDVGDAGFVFTQPSERSDCAHQALKFLEQISIDRGVRYAVRRRASVALKRRG